MSGIVLSASVRQNLLSLQSTADLLATTQSRLSTGKKVNTALDNPTNYFTAQSLDSRASELRRDVLIITVCGKGGGRSEGAASMLRGRGFSQVRSLCGGTDAWRRQAASGAGS